MLIIGNEEVAKTLRMEDVIAQLETAYAQVASGEAVCRPRVDIQIPTSDPKKIFQWGTMEGGSTGGYFAIRMKSDILYEQEYEGVITQEQYCVEPGTFCGLILLVAIDNGEPLALINDGVLQHMRVGGDGAIGVKYMARPDADVVGMLGSGGMARSHVESISIVRPDIRKLQVFSPTPENRERFGAEVRQQYGIEVEVCDRAEDVYKGAGILVAVTDSAVPALNGDWIEEGTHVISIGGGGVDARTLERVDRYLRFGSAPAPVGLPEFQSGDSYLTYRAEPEGCTHYTFKRSGKRGAGVLMPDRMVEFSEVLKDPSRARTSDKEITYSERGNLQGLQFYPLAGIVYEKAREAGLGTEIPTGLLLQDIRN